MTCAALGATGNAKRGIDGVPFPVPALATRPGQGTQEGARMWEARRDRVGGADGGET
ncbi:MAG: hypothetical protein NVS4B8_15010 [Herpetosiphon sp.]